MGYLDSLAHWYQMSVPVGMPDVGVVGGNPGTGANIVSNPPGVGGGICAELNGNNSNYNLGDVAELNSVSAFTIAFWMNQDVLDQADTIFDKRVDTTHEILLAPWSDGNFYFEVSDGAGTSRAFFDYSTVIAVGEWYHVAMVFDGTQAVSANRLLVYVGGNPVALTYSGTIVTASADLSGQDALIGLTANAFDGELDEFCLFSTALTNLQVSDLYQRSRRGMMKL